MYSRWALARESHMNERKQGQLAFKIAETEQLLEKFPNFGRLTLRIQELLRERTDALAKAGGLRLLSHARSIVFLERE